MLTPRMMALRASMVTSTEIVVLAGAGGKGRGACGIYDEKTSGVFPANDTGVESESELVDEDEETSDPIRLGHFLQPYLVDFAAKRFDVWTLPEDTYRHPTEHWIGATPDGIAVEPGWPTVGNIRPSLAAARAQRELAVIEAKVVGKHRFHLWGGWDEDEWLLPESVVIQCQWQMTAKRLKKAFVVALLGTHHRTLVLEHCDALEAELVAIGKDFWGHVERREMPPVDGTDEAWRMVRKTFPLVRRPEIVEATPEQAEMMRGVREAQEEEKAWKLEAARRKQELSKTLGELKGVETDGIRAAFSVPKEEGITPAFRVGPIKTRGPRAGKKTEAA